MDMWWMRKVDERKLHEAGIARATWMQMLSMLDDTLKGNGKGGLWYALSECGGFTVADMTSRRNGASEVYVAGDEDIAVRWASGDDAAVHTNQGHTEVDTHGNH